MVVVCQSFVKADQDKKRESDADLDYLDDNKVNLDLFISEGRSNIRINTICLTLMVFIENEVILRFVIMMWNNRFLLSLTCKFCA